MTRKRAGSQPGDSVVQDLKEYLLPERRAATKARQRLQEQNGGPRWHENSVVSPPCHLARSPRIPLRLGTRRLVKVVL